MDLTQTVTPAATNYSASGSFNATAEQVITIQTAPEGEEILEETVPAGKAWAVTVHITVVETDA